MVRELLGVFLVWAGMFGFLFFFLRTLIGINAGRDIKIARVKVEMQSGTTEYGNIPYRTKEQLANALAFIAKAKYRRDKSDQLKLVADVVKSVTVTHDNWPDTTNYY